MAKGVREKIKLVSSAGTGHFYTTTKNKRTKPEKLELKKFDPVVRQHVVYKKLKLNNFSGLMKTRPWPGFCFIKGRKRRREARCLNYRKLRRADAV